MAKVSLTREYGNELTKKSENHLHCEQSARWWTEVQRNLVRVVQWVAMKLGNSRMVIQKLDVKSDNFTEMCVFCFVALNSS